ncbi:hypothetical protein B296_00025711 [Ensete ventricosum]|uniref:Uncharacterized protein n=1 Tax=Ensete ventricosum TaxID=4639 RepID=A0A426Z834_ENSVE|nr:hypothetical protein B296_00025711 [Ensete ventricosum]
MKPTVALGSMLAISVDLICTKTTSGSRLSTVSDVEGSINVCRRKRVRSGARETTSEEEDDEGNHWKDTFRLLIGESVEAIQ